MRSSPRSLVLLLTLTVGLGALLAYEAQRATRSHRVTAERALRDYATVAAWEFLTAADEVLDRSFAETFGSVLRAPAASPYDSLAPLAALQGAEEVLRCGGAGAGEHFTFRLDFRTGALVTSQPASQSRRSRLRDSLLARVRGTPPPTAEPHLVWDGMGFAIYGVKVLRYSGFGQHEVPIAAYGLATCPDALQPVFEAVMKGDPLLPRSVTGGVPNAALVSLEVADPSGRPLFAAGPPLAGGYVGNPASAGAGALTVRATLPREVAGALVVASPRSRLPLLLGLLVLAAGFAVVAVLQLRREQELARLRTDFTSSVSHELRTPLTQILLFAETLELGREADEDARRQAVGIIVQEARRLTHLVENVLQFSRAERRLTRIRPEFVRLAPLLREIVERFAPLAGTAAIRLRTELDESLVAWVHPESLHQVVLNLLDNAVKHGGAIGPIVLRARRYEGRLRIEVEDAGSGVPVEDRARIWEPYVRLTRTPAVAGSGIGLAVVRELVGAHGGDCWVEDGTRGGARFVIELPGVERPRPADDPALETTEDSWREF